MSSEIHLFIIWSNAEHVTARIINDIKQYLNIKKIYKVEWSKGKFSENMSRFYGQNLPKGSDKEGHCGTGPFTCIIVEDINPRYGTRMTSRGLAKVNINIFDLKVKYRSWVDGYQIHATDNIKESEHDISLLFGIGAEEYFRKMKNNSKDISIIKQDLVGSDGWSDITQLFTYLNKFTKYIVLRNFECLPNEYVMTEHGDIDLLVENLEEVVYLTNAEKVFSAPDRVHYKIRIDNKDILFDFRYVGDGYYDEKFEKLLLDTRVLDQKGFYRPTDELYFVNLLYHALIHKPAFSEEYKNRLLILADKIKQDDALLLQDPVLLLIDKMDEYQFTLTTPIDSSVYYNSEVVDIFLAYQNLLEIFKSDYDIEQILLTDNRWLILKNLSPIRHNILNWYPFNKNADILEIGGECGAITGLLCEKAKSVKVVELSKRRSAINFERNKKYSNLEIIVDNLKNLKFDQKFDYVTLIGVFEYAGSFMQTDNPYGDFLKNVKNHLKEKGKLLIAIENRYGLKYFAGAKENHTGKEFDSITGYGENKNVKTFGKKELEILLKEAGYSNFEFYYPHPDYEMPFEIYSDDYLPIGEELLVQAPNYDMERYELFDESLAYKGIIDNRQYPFFANSFFVECEA